MDAEGSGSLLSVRDALIACMSAVTEATRLQTDWAQPCHAVPVAWIVEWIDDLHNSTRVVDEHWLDANPQ